MYLVQYEDWLPLKEFRKVLDNDELCVKAKRDEIVETMIRYVANGNGRYYKEVWEKDIT